MRRGGSSGGAKEAKHFATRERAAILLASNAGNSVPQIALMWMTDESHLRRIIHEFDERGMASLDPEYRGGRARRITAEQRRQTVAVAGARPDSQGVADLLPVSASLRPMARPEIGRASCRERV
jgi:transposase